MRSGAQGVLGGGTARRQHTGSANLTPSDSQLRTLCEGAGQKSSKGGTAVIATCHCDRRPGQQTQGGRLFIMRNCRLGKVMNQNTGRAALQVEESHAVPQRAAAHSFSGAACPRHYAMPHPYGFLAFH